MQKGEGENKKKERGVGERGESSPVRVGTAAVRPVRCLPAAG